MSSTSSNKKKGFIGMKSRSKKKSKEVVSNPITEKELLTKKNVTPMDVLSLTGPTQSNFKILILFAIGF